MLQEHAKHFYLDDNCNCAEAVLLAANAEYGLGLPDDAVKLVGGFGAGIPAEMDVPTYVGEDGLVHMDDINSVFSEFNWITSQTNMKSLLLNGEPILDFSQIPHHSFVNCSISVQQRYEYMAEL